MRFGSTHFSKDGRYWLGAEADSGRCYLGIPVSNAMVDYVEYYWIERAQFDLFTESEDRAVSFADACRRREHDALLVYQPGRDRGTPR